MKHWNLTGLTAVSLLGVAAGAEANDFHVVLNGFSQEVVASDGYTGVLGRSARTISWWYRSHLNSFPPVWGIIFWGQMWSIQLEGFDGGGINCECGGTKIAWTANKNPAMESLQDGQWHHLVMTAPTSGDYGDIELYLDGSLVPVVSVVGGSLTRTYDTAPGLGFRLGARDLGNHANADLDEVALWDVELSATAVAEIFHGGIPTDLTQDGSSYTNASNLHLYWRFGEGTGLTTADLSGSRHHGLLIDGDSVDSWGTNPPGSGSDSDGDAVLDDFDNCPDDFNPAQQDIDLDHVGDVCDPFPNDPDNDQAQCEMDRDELHAELIAAQGALDQCDSDLEEALRDSDQDGVIDLVDTCPATGAAPVDRLGCSLIQFCGRFAPGDGSAAPCKNADWRSDEPVGNPGDCKAVGSECLPR